MPSQVIQWFPGHMAKTKRLMAECLPQVDIVIELLDARIPASARNPEITKLVGDKPMLTLLTRRPWPTLPSAKGGKAGLGKREAAVF